MPNRHYLTLPPELGLFPNPETKERFRVIVRREGESVVATFFHWASKTASWNQLKTEDGQTRMIASIAADLEGEATIKSISFQMPADFSVISDIVLEPITDETK